MSTDDLLMAIAIVIVSVLGVALVATLTNGPRLIAFAVGVSAGLILVQFNGVHLYTLLVLAFVIASKSNRGFRWLPVLLTLAALLFASTAVFGGLVKSNGLAVQLVIMAVSSAMLIYRSSDEDLSAARNGLLAVTTVGSLIGIGQAIGLVPMALFQLEGAEMHRPASFYPEPDWLGMYAAVGVILALVAVRRTSVKAALLALNGVAVLIASARAAWVALAIVLIWAVVRAVFKRDSAAPKSLRAILIVVAAGSVFAWSVFPSQVQLATDRILAALEPGGGDSSVQARYGQIDGLMQLIQSAPLYGHGISAGGRVGGFGQIEYSNSGGAHSTASNWFLALLAEGMLLAMPLMAILLFLALFGRRALGGQQVLLLVLVNSLFSNAFYFPITWFAVSLALASSVATRLREVEAPGARELMYVDRPARA